MLIYGIQMEAKMKFENTQIFNIEGAIRGMRFAMKSEGDSIEDRIGERDLDLALRLCKAADKENRAHAKFLRQIFVSVDISAPRYLWQEISTYKISTTENSESTMHKLISDIEHLTENDFQITYYTTLDFLRNNIIPELQRIGLDPDIPKAQKLIMLKQILPESYIQKRHWTGNYEVIQNMYHQRKKHRLDDWNTDFVNWVKTLPYAAEFIIREEI